ncbi:hypothetical protein BDR26DRAFT_889996 [Obelidium mucronatum]|nr:hypothetical protein BDR26DRAFT_889996 [Obelidium mucronatum]
MVRSIALLLAAASATLAQTNIPVDGKCDQALPNLTGPCPANVRCCDINLECNSSNVCVRKTAGLNEACSSMLPNPAVCKEGLVCTNKKDAPKPLPADYPLFCQLPETSATTATATATGDATSATATASANSTTTTAAATASTTTAQVTLKAAAFTSTVSVAVALFVASML